MLNQLTLELAKQIEMCDAAGKVEILYDVDNREKTVGAKRNDLYAKAKGIYSVSIDSDDWVARDYISEHLRAAEEGCDAISLNGFMTINNENKISWRISKDNPYIATIEDNKTVYLRFNNHISAIKSEICKQFKFEDKSFGEDYAWALAIHNAGVIKTEAKTNGELYHYRYQTNK
jgi:hypothetical protein